VHQEALPFARFPGYSACLVLKDSRVWGRSLPGPEFRPKLGGKKECTKMQVIVRTREAQWSRPLGRQPGQRREMCRQRVL
jgi:hypothetical protein